MVTRAMSVLHITEIDFTFYPMNLFICLRIKFFVWFSFWKFKFHLDICRYCLICSIYHSILSKIIESNNKSENKNKISNLLPVISYQAYKICSFFTNNDLSWNVMIFHEHKICVINNINLRQCKLQCLKTSINLFAN